MKKKDFILLFIIIAIAAFLRFYHLNDRLSFDWDQENFAWQAKEMIVDHKFTLIGTNTSVGGMYLGPFYTYLSNFFYFLFQMNPIAGGVLSIIFGLLTIAALYILNLSLFNRGVAFVSALLYTFSFAMIDWDLIAWNPAPFYFYTLIVLYVLLKSLKNIKYLPILSFLFGIGLHIHLASVAFFPFIILPLFANNKNRVKYIFLSFFSFILAISPLIIFDLRHNFHNVNQLINFIFQQKNSFRGKGFQFMRTAEMISDGTFSFLISEIPAKTQYRIFPFLWLSVLVTYLLSSLKIRKILSIFFLIGIFNFLFFSVYPGLVLGYYFMVFIPLGIIIISLFIDRIFRLNKVSKVICLVFFILFIYINMSSWLKFNKVLSLKDKDDAVQYVINDSQGKPFRISYSTALGYDTGYRYLFWYHRAYLSTDVKNEVYTIVAPVGVYGIKPFKEFDGVGVLWEDGQKI
jgi:4-amino-4-deoxy-L-arabinose transferase-like glycosyltransferase